MMDMKWNYGKSETEKGNLETDFQGVYMQCVDVPLHLNSSDISFFSRRVYL